MKVRVIGDKTALDDDIRKRIDELEEASKNNDGLNFQIALNYGSRDEMIRAMKGCVQTVRTDACMQTKSAKQYLNSIWIHMIFRIRIF